MSESGICAGATVPLTSLHDLGVVTGDQPLPTTEPQRKEAPGMGVGPEGTPAWKATLVWCPKTSWAVRIQQIPTIGVHRRSSAA